jgi:hypothetical protein
MKRALVVIVLVVLVVLGACGGNRARIAREMQDFNCRDRLASYVAHSSGNEYGVQIDCAEAGPRIKRWRSDKQGKHLADERHMTPHEFDKLWSEIDAVGWPNLHDCTNGSLGKSDPLYQFDVHDDQNKSTFQCQTVEVPYPYDDIVNPLDLAANQGRKQLGGDDPSDQPDQKGKLP